MDVIDHDTGENFRLDTTDAAYCAAIDDHVKRFTCAHRQTELRRAVQADGRAVHRLQCLECGELTGPAAKQDKSVPAPPDEDTALLQRFQAEKTADRARVVQDHVRRQRKQGSEWRQRYNAYLETPHWQAKRDLVFKRAGRICEGCGTRPAEQVHHLTYRNAFDAFLFQLVAICKECHDRYHANEAQDESPPDNQDDYEESPCCGCRYQGSQDGRDWCGVFDIPSIAALAVNGGCGPQRSARESLR